MTYPYIAKNKHGVKVLIYSRNSARVLNGEKAGQMRDMSVIDNDWLEREYENITADYLCNTYGKVESKEYADFLVKLAGENKIKIGINGHSERRDYFYFTEDEGSLYLVFASFSPSNKHTSIAIPLPPKEPELKEWPQVGGEVLTASKQKAVVVAIDGSEAWIKYKNNPIGSGYASVRVGTLKKPPTPEGDLTEALLNYAMSNNYLWEWKDLAESIINGEIKGLSYKPG